MGTNPHNVQRVFVFQRSHTRDPRESHAPSDTYKCDLVHITEAGIVLAHQLGKIERVDIRTIWPNEERDFTPWLRDNIQSLSEKVQVGIEDIEIEQDVGDYSADMTGKVEGTDKIVVIENQYGETNHDHLGKLLTYLAGKGAKVGIWIAETFREEHIATLEYLNETSSTDGIALFGVELEAKRISDSKPAIEFTLAVRPNRWQREISQEPRSEADKKRHELRLGFFTKLADRYKELNPSWHRVKAQPQHWLSFSAGRSGFSFSWTWRMLGGFRFAIELYIDTGDSEENKTYFAELLQKKEEIEKQVGHKLDFQELSEKRASRIEVSSPPTGVPFTRLSDDKKRELVEWGAQTMLKFSTVLSKYVQALD